MLNTTVPRVTHKFLLLIALYTVSWASASQDIDKILRAAAEKYDTTGHETLVQWQKLIEDATTKREVERLLEVNDFINYRVKFTTDRVAWGKSDYWATPLETLGSAKGDCEDFSIAKYISLLKAEIPVEKLRLIYVKARLPSGISQAHMVLAYYSKPGADPLILDNLSKKILQASKRRDLVPVFSFNSAGLWAGSAVEPKVKKPETRLSKWRDVLLRMQLEGIY